MLQQTQVDRVAPKYREWTRRYPTVHALAKAPLARLRRQWRPLGYNGAARSAQGAGPDGGAGLRRAGARRRGRAPCSPGGGEVHGRRRPKHRLRAGRPGP
ncbi:MAG: hypothetical protein ACE5KY_05565 [Candidatus Tectimicrobiota bacterium]